MNDAVTRPLSRTQRAVAELAEMVALGRPPEEIDALGWEHLAELMEQRRRLILQAEIAAAPSCVVD